MMWLAALASPGAATAQAPVTVGDLRIGAHPGKTRVVLDLSAPVAFQVQTQADPFRVVLDLPETDWQSRSSPRPGGLVRTWRHGSPAPGATRLVFDVTGPVRVRQAFVLPPGDVAHARLVLDLEGVTQAAFAADAGAPHGTRVADPGVRPWRPGDASVAPARASAPAPVRVAAPVPALAPVPAPCPPPVPETAPRPAAQVQVAALPPVVIERDPIPQEAAAARVPLPPTAKPRTTKSRPMVVIDPGHGGADPGAISINGVYEKAITLQVARALREQLLATGRYRVALTRDGDDFVRLRDRVAQAREQGADLFISLHADSLGQANVSGMSVYTLSDKASDREAEMLAARENRADALGGLDLKAETDEVVSILIDLAQRDTLNQSRRVANLLVEEMGKQVRLLPRPHRSAGFAVLTAPDVPSVLIELGYLSNPKDAKMLTQTEHQVRLARSIARGIDGYFAAATGLSRS